MTAVAMVRSLQANPMGGTGPALARAHSVRSYAPAMHPYIHAQNNPEKPAYIMAGSGETVTYRQLDQQSNRIAQLFRSLGLKAGDHIALFLENNARFFEICWGAQRSGLIYTAISSRLTAAEVDYIVTDCGARLFVTSKHLAGQAAELAPLMKGVEKRYMVDGTIAGYESWEETVARFPATPIADQTTGHDMLYSSGTTGRPKGVLPVVEPQPIDFDNPLLAITRKLYGMDENTIYLSPAPLYHAAPLRFNMSVMRLGGTSVIMEHFDAEEFLALVGQYKATHTQLVPTMFVRFLKLPDAVRLKYDVSSLRCAIHAAAPCPIPVKEKMIDWWGPIVWEYYGGTEGNGLTICNAREWMAHKGTVGRAIVGTLRICDEDGNELPAGEPGTVYFADGRQVRVSQRSEEDRRIAPRQGLDHPGRRGLRRCRRLPAPDRPQGLHDHLGRGQHLPAGSREPPDQPSQGDGLRGVRRAQRRFRRGGEGRRPAARHGGGRPGAGR